MKHSLAGGVGAGAACVMAGLIGAIALTGRWPVDAPRTHVEGGGILPASMSDIPLDFDTLQPYDCFIGSAAIIVLSEHDRARDAALNLMHFFADESCGQCTPCRVGTEKAVGLLGEKQWDTPLLAELSQAMADASICGLGQAAPNPIRCVIKYFPDEIA